jgi:hypothetical protein
MALPIFTKERLLLILKESRWFSKYGGKIGAQSFLSQFDFLEVHKFHRFQEILYF